MYKAFRIKLDDIRQVVSTCRLSGQKQSELLKDRLISGLDKYLNVNSTLDGQRIMDDWFSEVKADIFISHSHRDDADVHGLAGWLKQQFGLVSFIDADVWGYCDDLLKQLDKTYSLKANGYYDYQNTRETSAHVHVMLMSALAKMINKTECLLFLDSDHSITARMSVLKTRSPWIYNELLISSMIRPQVIKRKKISIGLDQQLLFEERSSVATEMIIEYPVVYQHMKQISGPDLFDWLGLYKKYDRRLSTSYHEFPLDLLYWLKKA